MTRFVSRYAWMFVLVFFAFCVVSAQERVQGGPPPEIRNHIDSFMRAYNSGNSEEWEKMAQEHFSPAFLKRRTAEQRKEFFDRMRGDFGTIAITSVMREGPDEPLQIHVKSSNGTEAVINMTLESGAPYRIDGLGVSVGGPAQGRPQSSVPAPPVNGKMSDAEIARVLDGYLQRLTADDVFSGVVLVARDGKPVYEQAYGFADRSNRVPNTPATRFNLGSINKKFTQIAIQQLVARGKLSLTDTVGKVLPDYPQEVTRAATIEQLLHHSGGVADFFGEEFARTGKDRFRSNADYYKLVSSQKALFVPGTQNRYCNGCYIVLGAIIASVSGMPYEKYVEENIFKPAGMTATGAFQGDAILPDIAMGYTRRMGDGQLHSNVYLRGAAGCAAGGGFATARDLLAFENALKTGRLPDVKSDDGDEAIAGGAPGTSSVVMRNGPWTVVVLTNLDPRTGEDLGVALGRALTQ